MFILHSYRVLPCIVFAEITALSSGSDGVRVILLRVRMVDAA
jgi:hypothetical protein